MDLYVPNGGRLSLAQKEWLVAFMEQNPAMVRNQCYNLDGALMYQQRLNEWHSVALTLNEMRGARKTATVWKRCWDRLLNRTRQKVTCAGCLACGVGLANVAGSGLSPIERRLVRLMWAGEQIALAHSCAVAIFYGLPLCQNYYDVLNNTDGMAPPPYY